MNQVLDQGFDQVVDSRISTVSKKRPRSKRANIRLARFLVVLSLTTVFGAGFAMQAAAGSKSSLTQAKVQSYVTVTIAPGETIWSVAKAMGSQAPRQLVDQIITVNGLDSVNLPAGTQIRVPLN